MTVLQANIPEAGYGKKIILRNVTISVEDGEIVGLIGPNGAGKSTLLKVLIGILKLKSGEVQFMGTSILDKNPEEDVKLGISFVPQGNRVFTELTLEENLEIGGYLLSGKGDIKAQMERVLNFFPTLRDHLEQNAGKLSGGEKQQLALARALMLQPKLLLMDEPSLGLSPKLVSKAMDTIQEINLQFKTAVVIVEQKVQEVMRIAHRVYGLRMGEVVFNGPPGELRNKSLLKKIFLS